MSSKRYADDDDHNDNDQDVYDGDFRGEEDDDDDDDDDDEDEDDEDDDDEDEFIPGAEEAEDDEDHDGAGLDLMRGKCSLDDDQRLVLQGDGFSLCSTELFDSSCKGSSLLLVGHWQLAGADPKRKAPPRRINLSVAAADSTTNTPGKRSETERDTSRTDEEREMIFDIQGTEETTSDETIQFFGRVVMGTAAAPRDFTCRIRRIATRTTTTTATAGSTPPPPAAAASAKKSRRDYDDDDDAEGEDADDDVDFDELAALHEEARMSVDAVLNKRYRGSAGEAGQGDGSASKKRGKTESDDEEDIEF